MSDMSDFEQFWNKNKTNYYPLGSPVDVYKTSIIGKEETKEIYDAGWKAAKQSMQGEAVGVVIHADDISQPDTSGEHKGKYQNMIYSHAPLQVGSHVYTHAPDSAARIAEMEEENAKLTKELEEARKDAERWNLFLKDDRYQVSFNNGFVGSKDKIISKAIVSEKLDASLNIKGGAE